MKISTIAICLLISLCSVCCYFWGASADAVAQEKTAEPASESMDLTFHKMTSRRGLGNFTRTAVPGGWLVVHESFGPTAKQVSMVFIPDEDHKWNGKSIPLPRK